MTRKHPRPNRSRSKYSKSEQVADLRERPRHNVLHIWIFQKWNQNGNGARLLEIALFGLPW